MTNDIQFDPAKPVRTRDGRAAIIDASDARFTGGKTISARVTEREGYEVVYTYMPNGSLFHCGEVNHSDLINVPEQRHHWYNVYESGSAGAHYTRSKADKSATPGRIAVLHLIFEDRKLVSSEVEHV